MTKSTLPEIDECRYLILKIIEQGVRDYLSLSLNSAPIDRIHYESACQFLFDDSFTIKYGGDIKNLEDLLDIIEIDIDWFRRRITKLKNIKIEKQQQERRQNVQKNYNKPKKDL